MGDLRARSRAIAREKLALREVIESRLATQIESELRDSMPTVTAAAARTASKIAAVIASQIAALPQAKQRTLALIEDDAEEYATEFVQQFVGAAARGLKGQVRKIATANDLGMQLPDDWAGPVAGPTLLEQNFGIPRSTLHRWRKVNLAIAINMRTTRKPVFPLLQFEDGAPIKGIAKVVEAFGGNHKASWRWLITSCADLSGEHPLEVLKKGDVDRVASAARVAASA